MKFSVRRILLLTVSIAVVFALAALSIKLTERNADLMALKKIAIAGPYRHTGAEIRVSLIAKGAKPRVFTMVPTTNSSRIYANIVSRSASPEADAQFSFVARYLCSAQDGDVYEVIWNERTRLPPEPSSHDFPESSKIIKTWGGLVSVYQSDTWIMEIADSTNL